MFTAGAFFGLFKSEARAPARVGFSLQNHSSELSRKVQYFWWILGPDTDFYIPAGASFPGSSRASGKGAGEMG